MRFFTGQTVPQLEPVAVLSPVEQCEQAEREVDQARDRIMECREQIRHFCEINQVTLEQALTGMSDATGPLSIQGQQAVRAVGWQRQARAMVQQLFKLEQQFYDACRRWAGLKD